MPKQEFDFLDYFAPVVVALIFAVVLFLISFLIINWFCITHNDDLTGFEKIGAKCNIRLGPHTLREIQRGGFPSTYAIEQHELVRKNTKPFSHA